MKLRTNDRSYMVPVEQYWRGLFRQLVSAGLLVRDNGPIAAVQLENEYGSYGDVENNAQDAEYMELLYQIARAELGPDVVLYTTDPPGSIARGTLKTADVISMVDFGPGTDVDKAFAVADQFNPPGNRVHMVTEFYTGWLTHEGDRAMVNRSTSALMTTLTQLLARDASFSLYMAHGGSNWAFWNGANSGNSPAQYSPSLPSYDYDAPIAQDGSFGYGSDGENKFLAIRRALGGRSFLPPPPNVQSIGSIKLTKQGQLSGMLDVCAWTGSERVPKTMEMFNQTVGLIAYEHESAIVGDFEVDVGPARDFVTVFVDGAVVAMLSRADNRSKFNVTLKKGSVLRLLVENRGRLNFGPFLNGERKGLDHAPTTSAGVALYGWKTCLLPLDKAQVANVPLGPAFGPSIRAPAFFAGEFNLQHANFDTFLGAPQQHGFSRGIVFVNGFAIGRYNAIGPQFSTYVPGTYGNQQAILGLVPGRNQVMILELGNSTIDVLPQLQTFNGPQYRH